MPKGKRKKTKQLKWKNKKANHGKIPCKGR